MTFSTADLKPFIVAVCVAKDARMTSRVVQESLAAGADMVEVNLAQLSDSEIQALSIPTTTPYYVVCRRRDFMKVYGLGTAELPERDDAARMRLGLKLIKAGARALDMECDAFKSTDEMLLPQFPPRMKELATSAAAISAQREIMNECRNMGAKVILSCHSGAQLDDSQTVALAQLMFDRGADVIKIVNSHAECGYIAQLASAIIRLRQRIRHPFMLTSIGPLSEVMRLFASYLGNAYIFCRPVGPSAFYGSHPSIAAVRSMWQAFPPGVANNSQ